MERIIDNIKKRYKDFELWMEDKETITIEEGVDGVRKENHAKKELAVRVFKDGLVGFGYASGEENIDNLLENIELSIKYSEKDDCNVLPNPEYKENSQYGTEKEFELEEIFQKMDEMKDFLRDKNYLKNIERISGSVESRKVSFFNSLKGYQHQIIQKYALGIVVVVNKDGDEKIEWDFGINDNLKYLDGQKIASKAYNRAINLLNSSPIYTGEYTILFEPRASCDFLEVFAQSFIAENVFKKRSLFADNIIFSDKINLFDNPMVPESSVSYFFDGEGFLGKNKQLIQNGVIQDFLYDNFYGMKMGKKSTGNSVRNKISTPPRNWFSTIVLDKGQDDIKRIIKGKKVINVVSLIGMHLVNPVTGDFSVGFEGYLLDDGDFVKALSGVSIAGNLKNFYKNIVAIDSDFSVYGQTGSPSILVDGIVVSGI